MYTLDATECRCEVSGDVSVAHTSSGWKPAVPGGGRGNKALEGPARLVGTHSCGIFAVDPRPPHDLYFWSNYPDWRGRIGRLFQAAGAWSGGGK